MNKQEYLKNPALCPYCGSNDLETDGSEPIDLHSLGEIVTCNKCEAVWQDVYTMTDVIEIEIPNDKPRDIGLFRDLSPEEEKDSRKWARDNFTKDMEICEVWHPVVRDECFKMLEEWNAL